MAKQTVPVAEAVDTLDTWANVIAGHVATDHNTVRVGLEARYALENMEAIAKVAPPGLRQNFYGASLNLLSVIRPLLSSPADRAACDQLRAVIEGDR